MTLAYPGPALERTIVEAGGGCTPAVAARLVQLAQALRRLTHHDLEETASTRLLVMAAQLAASGLPLAAACRSAVVDALTDDAETADALGSPGRDWRCPLTRPLPCSSPTPWKLRGWRVCSAAGVRCRLASFSFSWSRPR